MGLELKEGRFAAIGEPGTGILGAIETEFIGLLGGASAGRSLSTLEGILTRAITRGWLKSLGGVLNGRYELTLPIGQSSPVVSDEHVVELKQKLFDLNSRFEQMLGSAVKKATLPLMERVDTLEAQVSLLLSTPQQKADAAPSPAAEKPKGRPRRVPIDTGDKW